MEVCIKSPRNTSHHSYSLINIETSYAAVRHQTLSYIPRSQNPPVQKLHEKLGLVPVTSPTGLWTFQFNL